MTESMLAVLPTKLSYENNRSVPGGLDNVLDFQRLSVKLWNQPNLTTQERQLFERLSAWNNIWVARKNGFLWCNTCEDSGQRTTRKGTFTCGCAADGYRSHEALELSEDGLDYERRVASTPKECVICHGAWENFITNGWDFYYICGSPVCQERVDQLNEGVCTDE